MTPLVLKWNIHLGISNLVRVIFYVHIAVWPYVPWRKNSDSNFKILKKTPSKLLYIDRAAVTLVT